MTKFPDASDNACRFVPFTEIVAPGNGSPEAFAVIFPATEISCALAYMNMPCSTKNRLKRSAVFNFIKKQLIK